MLTLELYDCAAVKEGHQSQCSVFGPKRKRSSKKNWILWAQCYKYIKKIQNTGFDKQKTIQCLQKTQYEDRQRLKIGNEREKMEGDSINYQI